MKKSASLLVGLLVMARGVCLGQGNLLPNGDFENPEDPLAGWTTNYEWLKNPHFMNNHNRLRVLPRVDNHRNVLCLDVNPQTKVESQPFPYEPGDRYRGTLDMKGNRGRFYFAGYRWKPGVRPYENPHPGDLRLVYKGKAVMKTSRTWSPVTIEFPMKDLSETASRHLRAVRFFTIYIWAGDEDHPDQKLYVDNVRLQKIR